jgi:hypothetical protein
MAYKISGMVYENGSIASRLVRLYLRSSGELLAEEYSNSSGEFEFVGIAEFGAGIKFYVIALDDAAGADYNALIYDDIEPVEFVAGGAHRYWRIKSINLPGGTHLEISEVRLFELGADVTASATKTSSDAPDFGALSELFDSNLTTRPFWVAATAEGAGFYLHFDFGSNVAVDGLKQGGFDTSNRYMESFGVEYSDDNVFWVPFASKSGLTYPGNNTLSSEYALP